MKATRTFSLLSLLLAQSLFSNAAPIEDKEVVCKQKSLGYNCCKITNTHVYYQDKDGDWGYDFENQEWCGISTLPMKGDYYAVFAKAPEADWLDEKFDQEIQSRIDQFGKIILDNLDTYEDKDKLEQFQQEFKSAEGDAPLKSYFDDSYLYTNDGKSAFLVYLNENLLDQVRALPGVLLVDSGIKFNPSEEVASTEYVKCSSAQKALGYSCCKKNNTKVYSQDKRGDWGYDFENKEWCGLATVPVTPLSGSSYLINVKKPEAEQNSDEFNQFVQSIIDQIGQVIVDNLDTYEDKAKLEQFQQEFKPNSEAPKKYADDSYLYTNGELSTFVAYLNENLLSEISAIPGVLSVAPNQKAGF